MAHVVVVQSLSHVQLFVTPWTAARQAPLSFTISWSLLKLMSVESVMPSNYLIHCHSFLFLQTSVFPSIRVFSKVSKKSWLFASGGQSIGASASQHPLPMNIQGWFPLGLTDLISLLSKGLSRIFSSTTVEKHRFFGTHPSLWSSSYIHAWLTGKTIALTILTFVYKVMSLLFNTLPSFIIAFLPMSYYFLDSYVIWL